MTDQDLRVINGLAMIELKLMQAAFLQLLGEPIGLTIGGDFPAIEDVRTTLAVVNAELARRIPPGDHRALPSSAPIPRRKQSQRLP